MQNLALKTTLAALLVSIPLAGAFADNTEGPSVSAPAYSTDWQVDRTHTSSIGNSAKSSYARQLDGQLRAAETRLNFSGRDGYVDPVGAAQARSDILSIRQAAAQDRQANGGVLSESAYNALSSQVRVLNQNVQALVNGG